MAAAEPPESDRDGPAPAATYVGSAACKKCHEEVYARWSKSRMANVVRDPREHPDAIIPDFSKPDPLRHLHQGRHRVRLRQPLEAALFQEDRRRLFPVARAVGRHAQEMAALFRRQRTATGGLRFIRPATISSGRPGRYATAAIPSITTSQPRTSTEWNVGCEKCHGPGQRACRAPGGEQHPQSRPLRLCARQRHLHPMSFPGPAAEESDRTASTTIGRSAFTSASIWRISGNWRSTSSGSRPSPTSRTAPRTRTACRGTISSRA